MRASAETLLDRARSLLPAASGPGRALLGITGPPGAGKSTLAEALVTALAPTAALLPMDGFHLPQARLRALGRRDRMGAPDTFDVAGFVAALGAVRESSSELLLPGFDRRVEEPVPDAITIPAAARLVVVEGNYLLLDDGDWAGVRELLDEVWYVDPPAELRLERLLARHVAHGKSPAQASAWVQRSDEANAACIAATRHRAHLVVSDWAGPVA